MANLIDWGNLNEKSLYEQLKERINIQKELDKSYLKEDFGPDEIEEQTSILEENYDIYNQKLEFIKKINELDNEKKGICIRNLVEIDCSKLNSKRRFRMMLSYSVLADYYKKINERTLEELFMLSACTMEFDLDEYDDYMKILSDKTVAESIVNKTSDLEEQIYLAYAVMEAHDKLPDKCAGPDNYDELVDNAINAINNYSIGHTK